MTGFDPGNNHLLGGKDLLPPRLKHMVHEPCAASSCAWGCCFFGAPPDIAAICLFFGILFPQASTTVCCIAEQLHPGTVTRGGVWGWLQALISVCWCSGRFGCSERFTEVAKFPQDCFGVSFAYFRLQSLHSWLQGATSNCVFDC